MSIDDQVRRTRGRVPRSFARLSSAPLALAGAAMAWAGCSKSPPSPSQAGLMVIVSTNLTSSEYDALEVDVSQEVEAGTWHAWLAQKSYVPSEAKLPTTIFVQSGQSADQDVRVLVTAYRAGAPVVLREVQTQAPTDRIAELRLVLAELCKGDVALSGTAPASTCPLPDQSCQPETGLCGPNLVPGATLPTYQRGDETLDAAVPTPDASELALDAGDDSDAASSPADDAAEAAAEASIDASTIDASTIDASTIDASTCVATACTAFGTVCTDAQTLATCGKDPSGCFHVASSMTCVSPQSCSGMSPTATCALTCTDSCAQPGQTACISGALATCTRGANGCLAYAAGVACGSHQTCTGTAGSAACTCNTDPYCSTAGMVCAGTTSVATCALDVQGCAYASVTAACTNGACSAGACCTNACTTASTQCAPTSSTSYQTCGPSGSGCTVWSTSACSGSLVCERSGGVSCVDPTWAEWPMPNSQVESSGGAPNLESYTDNGDGTVTDNVTGLVWQKATAANQSQAGAITYCTNLSLGGFSDWRVPSIVEIVSLVDTSHSGPAIDTAYFPGTQSTAYWTSSSTQWNVDFIDGSSGFSGASSLFPVRCVR
jgi:hypothetical protein